MIEPRGMNPSFREPTGCLVGYRYLSVSEARQGTREEKKTFRLSRSLFCLPAGGFSDGQVSNAEAVDALKLDPRQSQIPVPF